MALKRWLYHYESVHGAPERLEQALRHRIRDLLGTVTDGQDAELTAEGELLVRLPAQVLGRELRKLVRLHTGVAEQRGARTCIPLRWHADPAKHAFPSFEGTIELEPQAPSLAHLTIVGAARLPLGPLGAAADAAALGGVADRTVRHLTERLAAALEEAARQPEPHEQQEEAASPSQLRVRDVMTPDPLVMHEDMPLITGALLLFHYDITGAPVRSDAGGLVGVLSEADLLDAEAPLRHGFGRDVEASRRRKGAATVGEACSRPALEVAATALVRQAAELMRDNDVARLVVVDGSDIVGVISRHDVLKALLRSGVVTQAALDRLLAEQGEDQITATVDWGIAHLTGRASTRSRAATLPGEVEALDGVIAVDSDLTWAVDDILPPVLPT